MKVSDVKLLAECLLSLGPQLQHLELANLVSEGLAGPADIAINLIDDVRLAFGGVGQKIVDGALS